ncbi:TPM domain-containing protein [Hoeflea prorocentri]|uniref:TPM domain-containing protein n=1 Tax=Hoeflea prorocentri TaxID=1922333 RepID=A0A9X3UME6_9HYPH|nr:TPM domain-containing protein [Hoeflea prorocentri]MCY6383216.1 TPM domain-containing protein [Hoeflea prorocentri]MDA5401016.1 TPM domain-containing protein [Hoeflea prorocentri]
MLTDQEHRQVADAIKAAEEKTSGEIYCVVCRQSDPYFMAAAFVLSCAALVIGTLSAWVLYWLWIDIGTATFTTALFCAWLLAIILIWQFPALRLRFVTKAVRYRRSHAQAVQQFLAHNIHATPERTGVLVFVSLAERYAEVVADSGISERVGQENWNSVVAIIIDGAAKGRLADALTTAAQDIGAHLARHFPASSTDRNELPDRVVEM